jgi:origin recognition complex subunit 5
MQLVLPVYSAPVIEDKVETVNARALMRLAEPHIKQCLDEVNLREDGLTYKVKAEGLPVAGVNGAAVVTKQASRLSVELPFLSKFLLIAAFLASYNPAKSDKKFFVQVELIKVTNLFKLLQ